jgi:hypothetical protein
LTWAAERDRAAIASASASDRSLRLVALRNSSSERMKPNLSTVKTFAPWESSAFDT